MRSARTAEILKELARTRGEVQPVIAEWHVARQIGRPLHHVGGKPGQFKFLVVTRRMTEDHDVLWCDSAKLRAAV